MVAKRLGVVGAISALALVLSSCSVLEDLGLWESNPAALEEAPVDAGAEAETPAGEVPPTPGTTGIAVPSCDALYSPDQTQELLDQVRVSLGDTSEGNYGYGTTNQDLVAILKNVRADLRISCTWYLPASESVSVTSVAIIGSDVESDLVSTLDTTGAVTEEAGSGKLWILDEAFSEEAGDYIATEAHYVAEVPCPSSLADTSCAVWITTNYAFGQARVLTVDAATQMDVF